MRIYLYLLFVQIFPRMKLLCFDLLVYFYTLLNDNKSMSEILLYVFVIIVG